MLANFFNKTKPINILSIICFLFLYYFVAIFLKFSEDFSLILLMEKLVLFLLYILIILIFDFIVKKNKLTSRNSYALLLFTLFLGSFPEIFNSYSLTISNLILLLAYRKIYSLKSEKNIKKKLFDAGFWIAIASLVYFWSILSLLLIYIAIVVFKKLTFKNLMVPMIGGITPIFLYFTYNDYINQSVKFFDQFNIARNLDFSAYNSSHILLKIILIALVLFWAIIKVTPQVVMVSNKLKSLWILMLVHVIIALFIIVIVPEKNGSELFFLFFPSAIIIANFIQKLESSLIQNMILYLFFAVSMASLLL